MSKAKKSAPPATPDEAERIAVRVVGEYLTACRMVDASQIGNYLMKLASVTGCVMAQAVGSQEAHDRLCGTAEFVLREMPELPARVVPVQ